MPPNAPVQTAARPPAARPASPGAPAGGGAGLAATIDPRKLALQYWPWLVGSLVGGVVLGVVMHFALLFVYPLYDGKVIFEMLPSLETADQAKGTVGEQGEAEMKRFIGNQTQMLVSDNVLLRAVDDPKVKNDTKWIRKYMKNGAVDKQEAARDLEDITSARAVPESTWVELRVRTTNRTDAATLANAVKDVYMSQLKMINTRDSTEVLEVMNSRLVAAQEERRTIEAAKDRLIGASRIEVIDERLDSYSRKIEEQAPILVQSEYQREQLRSYRDQYKEQREAPGGPTYPDLVREEIEQNPVIVDLKRQIAGTRTSLGLMIAQYGRNHIAARNAANYLENQELVLEATRQNLMRETFDRLIDRTNSSIRSLDSAIDELTREIQNVRLQQAEVSKLRERYKNLEEDLKRNAESTVTLTERIQEQKAIIDRAASNRVKVLADADIQDTPSFPYLPVIVALVAFLCVSLTAGFIVLKEALEQRVRGPADVASIPRVRVMGVIPDISEDPSAPPIIEAAVRDRPSGVVAEQFRHLRSEIVKWRGRREHAALLVMGGMPRSGATTVVANLAQSCADSDHKVLVIDANLRRPRVHQIIQSAESPGLSEVLAGKASFEEAIRHTKLAGLDVMTCGATDGRSMERLTTGAMTKLLDEARARYDLVLVDVAPPIVASDAIMLANRCDGVLLVVRAFGERRGLVARIRNQLEDAKAEFLGVVINGVRSSAGGYFRRNFEATHAYGAAEPAEHEPAPRKRGFGLRRGAAQNGDASLENGRLFDPEPSPGEKPPRGESDL